LEWQLELLCCRLKLQLKISNSFTDTYFEL
jgi:hypothetical protein